MNDENKIYYHSVGELIEILKRFPQDMPVVVSAYESGYENFFIPLLKKLNTSPIIHIGMENFNWMTMERKPFFW